MDWINIDERMPETVFPYGSHSYECSNGVLVATHLGIYIAYSSRWDEHETEWKLVGRDAYTLTEKVTHWAPLPANPNYPDVSN